VTAHPLRLRVVSAVALAVPAAAAIHYGTPYMQLLLAPSVVVMAWEWLNLCGAARARAVLALVAGLQLAVVAAGGAGAFGSGLTILALGTAVIYLLVHLGGRANAGWIAAGVLYIGLPSLAITWLRADPASGRETVLWIVATVAATDIGAYFSGRAIGGPRLAPRLSPGKTWAGAVGGAAAAVAASAAAALLAGAPGVGALAAAGLAVALVAQAGDLLESAIKRRFGVKDIGGIMPGHGGLFDRVDGLVAALVVVAAGTLVAGGHVIAWQ